ncbi:MAG: 4-hydroxy-tetrahydrodipicolinate synthase [Candidatus Competibacteraceae bacterium]|nr:4-hydroxy-tetrahydrodipicolinate synthase [Candidatus Competibacteraceae bacterium]
MFHGSMVALVTPMAADGSLDFQALARLVDFHVDSGTDAIVAVGPTGESSTLDFEEHEAVIRRVVDYARGRIPVIAGTGANSTTEAIYLTQVAQQTGADACLLVVPYYNKPTQEGLYRHFRTISEAVPIPQILYNVPGRTGCDMQPKTVARLAEIPNIVGIKEASGSLERIRELVALCGAQLDILSGDDHLACQAILDGGRGVISVTANVAPRLMQEMCAAALAGDRRRAQALDDRLSALHQALFLEANPIPVKWAVAQLGLMPEGIRLPMTPRSESCHEPVRRAMAQAGVL